VNIERQQVKLLWHTELLEQRRNVFLGCKSNEILQAILLEVLPVFQSSQETAVSIDPKSDPALRKEKCSVVFTSIPNPHFREDLRCSPNAAKYLMDNSVLPIL